MGNYRNRQDRGAFYQGGRGRVWRVVGNVAGEDVRALYDESGSVVRDALGRPVSNLRQVAARAAARASSFVGLSFSVQGQELRQLQRQLESIPDRLRSKVLRRSLRAWANAVRKTVVSTTPRSRAAYTRYVDPAGKGRPARAKVPEPGGLLRKSMAVRVRSYRQALWAAVGPRDSKGGYGWAGWRVHFTEGGFYNRRHGRRWAGRHMLANAERLHAPRLPAMVAADVEAVCREVSR